MLYIRYFKYNIRVAWSLCALYECIVVRVLVYAVQLHEFISVNRARHDAQYEINFKNKTTLRLQSRNKRSTY